MTTPPTDDHPPPSPTAPPTPPASPSAAKPTSKSTPRSPASASPSPPAAKTAAPPSTTSPAATRSVLDLIKSYGDAVERLETGAFSITPELKEHGRGERVHAYHGRVHITAELTDFTALGELTTSLADLELTSVDGPWWALRPDSPAHREARQQAVREAVQRASEYAEALGTTLAALVELADIGAEDPEPRSSAKRAAHAPWPTRPPADTSAAPLDLEPQRQTRPRPGQRTLHHGTTEAVSEPL